MEQYIKRRKKKGYNHSLNNWIGPRAAKAKKNKYSKSDYALSMSKYNEHNYCRDCGCILEKRVSRIWGICPSCDTQ